MGELNYVYTRARKQQKEGEWFDWPKIYLHNFAYIVAFHPDITLPCKVSMSAAQVADYFFLLGELTKQVRLL